MLKQSKRKGGNEEKEIKVQISKEQYDRLLNNQPAKAISIRQTNQKDIYYDREDLYITNLNRGLRVRFKGLTPACLEFKSLFFNPYARNTNPWFIEEITFPFPLKLNHLKKLFLIFDRLHLSFPAPETSFLSQSIKGAFFPLAITEQILFNYHLTPMIIVKKNRVGYFYNQAQYLFDHIEGLGYFLEIESEKDDPLEILNRLVVDNYQIIRNGYNDMLAVDNPSYLPNEEKQKRFKENPRWNILPNETEIVEAMLLQTKPLF